MIIKYNKQYVDKSDIREVEKVLKSELITTGPYIAKLERTFNFKSI